MIRTLSSILPRVGLVVSGLLGLLVSPAGAAEAALPAFQPNATVLFIGDSITDGGRARSGRDYNHTMGQGYAFILSATIGNRLAERNLTFENRGISGNRVVDLQKRWKADALDLKPDILSILIGINDTLWKDAYSAEEFERQYDQLLAETLAALPHVRIILGEPFLLPAGKYKNMDTYAATLLEVKRRQAAVARLAAKYKLPLVRYQQAFDQACRRVPADRWCWDGIHPHYAGHSLMADEWLKTAAELKP